MSIKGDWGRLQSMIRELRGVSGLMEPVTKLARERVRHLYGADFAGQHDPWGNRWAPTKSGGSPVLYKTGRLAMANISYSRGSVRVLPPYYWIFLQSGANHMPQRAVLPFGASPWLTDVGRVLRTYIESYFASADG